MMKNVVVGAAGVAVAAGAVAAGMALSNKDTRKKIAKNAQAFVKATSEVVSDITKESKDVLEDVNETVGSQVKNIKKKIS